MREKLGNPKNTIEVIQKYQFAFQKKFGQNFLIDPHVLDKIIGAAGVTKEDMVLEIGPGIGTMTQYLAEAAREVVAVEIDNNLIPILKETLAEYDGLADRLAAVVSGRGYSNNVEYVMDPERIRRFKEDCSRTLDELGG